MDELGEHLGSKLSGRPAQHHQLDPLGDSVTQGYGTLHHGNVLHAAVANVILIVDKLAQRAERGEREALPRKLQGISLGEETAHGGFFRSQRCLSDEMVLF